MTIVPALNFNPKPGNHLLAIQTLAGLAQWIDVFLLFSVPSFLWKSSPAEMALLASCFGLPSLFLGPFIGALLDCSDPRKMLMAGAVARTALSAVIAFVPGFFAFAVLVLLKGIANLLYWPASAIMTNHVVDEAERVRYFSSLSVLDQITKIATPLAAGLLALLMNSQRLFLASASMTLLCAFLLPRLGKAVAFTPIDKKRTVIGLLNDLRLGLGFIKTMPTDLLISVLLGIGMSLALAIYDSHLAAFLGSRGFDASAFSLLVSATGAGAVGGALLVRFVLKAASQVALIFFGVAAFATAVTAAAVTASVFPSLLGRSTVVAMWALNGLGYEVFVIGCGVNMQNLCPRAWLGRINTSVRSLQMIAVVAGPGIGAWLISIGSRTMPFAVSAGLTWLLLLSAMAVKAKERGMSP